MNRNPLHDHPRSPKSQQEAKKGDRRDFDGEEYESVGTIRDAPGGGLESPDNMSKRDLEGGGQPGDRVTDEPLPAHQRQYWRKVKKEVPTS